MIRKVWTFPPVRSTIILGPQGEQGACQVALRTSLFVLYVGINTLPHVFSVLLQKCIRISLELWI